MTKKPKHDGRGRPALPPEQRRSVTMAVRLSEPELELLRAAAGETPATVWARDVLLRAAKRRLA